MSSAPTMFLILLLAIACARHILQLFTHTAQIRISHPKIVQQYKQLVMQA